MVSLGLILLFLMGLSVYDDYRERRQATQGGVQSFWIGDSQDKTRFEEIALKRHIENSAAPSGNWHKVIDAGAITTGYLYTASDFQLQKRANGLPSGNYGIRY